MRVASKITEGTLIPVSLVTVAVSLMIGLAVDYTNTKADVRAAVKENKETKENLDSTNQKLDDINDNLVSIMVKLGLQPNKSKRNR